MTQWIRWWGLGLFTAICLVWWLSIDWVVENAVERFGTEAMGAMVELDSAEIGLSPLSISLYGLQVTDPEQPMQNLFIAKQIELSLDPFMLLRRKIISEQMTINGLQLYSPRTRSGATKKSTGSINGNQGDSTGISLPGVSLPSTDDLIAQQKDEIQREIDSIQNNIATIKNKWKNKQDELPSKDAIDDYKRRFNKLKKGNFLEKITGLKSLRKDIKKDLDVIETLDSDLDKDMAAIKHELNRAKQLPGKQADKMLAKIGINASSGDLAQALLGGQLQQKLQQALGLLAKVGGGEDESAPAPRGKGTWVSFDEQQPLPDLLLQAIKLSGTLTAAKQQIDFSGELLNVSHQPRLWHKPLSFSITGASAQGANLKATGILDHRNTAAKDSVSFSLDKLALNDYPLSDTPSLSLLLKKGVFNTHGKLSVIDQKLNFTSHSNFADIKLESSSTEASNTSKSKLIVSTLSGINKFDLTLAATGNYNEPVITVKSSLDNVLKDVLKTQLNKETSKLKGELEKKLSQQLSEQLGELDSEAGSLDEFKAILDQNKAELGKIKI